MPIETDGPLKGQAVVQVVIGLEQTRWLAHAALDRGCTIADLVRISAEESALGWAKANRLLERPTDASS
jgi:hypothetical protein